jgi:protein-tyrosine phosphatase
MDYAQILPELFVGSCPRDTDDIDRLRREAHVTAVLNLQTDDDLLRLNLRWETLLAHYKSCHIEVRRVPVRDFDAAELRSKLPECVRTLDGLLASSHLVYLHCTAGINRSPTVAMAFLHRCRGWTLDEASAYVTERLCCSPNAEAALSADWGHAGEKTARASNPPKAS